MERGFKWPAMEDCLNLERGFFEAAHCAVDNAAVALEKHRDELTAPPHDMDQRANECFAASNRHADDADKIVLRQWDRIDALENQVGLFNKALVTVVEDFRMLTKTVDALTEKDENDG